MIGFFGYDLAPRLERLPRRSPRDSRLPDIRMALYDTAVIVDAPHRPGRALGLGPDRRRAAGRRSGAAGTGARRIDRALRSHRGRRSTSSRRRPRPVSSFDREAYLATVRRVLEYIAAGDVFQVNLSQRFTARGRSIRWTSTCG